MKPDTVVLMVSYEYPIKYVAALYKSWPDMGVMYLVY